MFYGLLKRGLIGPAVHVVFRPQAEGVEHIPAEGPVLLVANHQSFSDSIFMPLLTPRPVKFLAKAEYFTGGGIKGRLSAGFFRGVGSIPIDRSGARAADAALNTALRLLEEGQIVGLYPEGTRSPDGRLFKGRTGAARIALTAGCPVLPCAIEGTERVQPTGSVLPRVHRVTVTFGPALDFSRYGGELWDAVRGTDAEHTVLRAVTDEIMSTLMRMTGREYVDRYASEVKSEVKSVPRKDRGTERARSRTGDRARSED
ncbi:1-acyl-sn-glycerol-3-phosphate acyltransferase [Actinospica durhamensis]|uniref:1-acyl-sn-glycerol-3-phosphate acyltransferase n=1 Tax=Actinospica durhamensis TaxID=1508375 RepID=A0A941ILV9_9ACTN|nr:lysophospholipid acyltransferase family protein [Actinospica durhamensis]MBR7832184.1 1-acyl-sn-glycerol-3-phosphate acyltransferase [Actinospica durhamensis]